MKAVADFLVGGLSCSSSPTSFHLLFEGFTVEKDKVNATKAEKRFKMTPSLGHWFKISVSSCSRLFTKKIHPTKPFLSSRHPWEVHSLFHCLKLKSASWRPGEKRWGKKKRKSESYAYCSLFYCKIKSDHFGFWQIHCAYQFALCIFILQCQLTAEGVRQSNPNGHQNFSWPCKTSLFHGKNLPFMR